MGPFPGFRCKAMPPQPNRSNGPIIEELNSDDENEGNESEKNKNNNPRKHERSSNEPFVEDPDDEASEKKSKQMASRNDFNQMQNVRLRPQTSTFTFQSSSVTYGGANGAYHSSSRTRRTESSLFLFMGKARLAHGILYKAKRKVCVKMKLLL
ncbi:unnamed protein product [Fraxinus pennsylvanica]|uniref:Uncharacterized protein n=1 Tax=Fraxinus pennsylvanica TaxID=56036 RepID=A0AAD1ZN37_9LAMI|nr:unnamed protein product [Fraxinus pennsylvanica]